MMPVVYGPSSVYNSLFIQTWRPVLRLALCWCILDHCYSISGNPERCKLKFAASHEEASMIQILIYFGKR